MKKQETLTALEVDCIINSWIYKQINDYLDRDFVTHSYLHGNPDCCEDPLYANARLFGLDRDRIGEDDPANVVIKHMFNNLVANASKVREALENNESYNSEMRSHIMSIDFSLGCEYKNQILVDSWFAIKDIIEYRMHEAVAKIRECGYYPDFDEGLFEDKCDITWLSRALSYSILSDARWDNYFKLITNATR